MSLSKRRFSPVCLAGYCTEILPQTQTCRFGINAHSAGSSLTLIVYVSLCTCCVSGIYTCPHAWCTCVCVCVCACMCMCTSLRKYTAVAETSSKLKSKLRSKSEATSSEERSREREQSSASNARSLFMQRPEYRNEGTPTRFPENLIFLLPIDRQQDSSRATGNTIEELRDDREGCLERRSWGQHLKD